jgi:hypothetical protein
MAKSPGYDPLSQETYVWLVKLQRRLINVKKDVLHTRRSTGVVRSEPQEQYRWEAWLNLLTACE